MRRGAGSRPLRAARFGEAGGDGAGVGRDIPRAALGTGVLGRLPVPVPVLSGRGPGRG